MVGVSFSASFYSTISPLLNGEDRKCGVLSNGFLTQLLVRTFFIFVHMRDYTS